MSKSLKNERDGIIQREIDLVSHLHQLALEFVKTLVGLSHLTPSQCPQIQSELEKLEQAVAQVPRADHPLTLVDNDPFAGKSVKLGDIAAASMHVALILLGIKVRMVIHSMQVMVDGQQAPEQSKQCGEKQIVSAVNLPPDTAGAPDSAFKVLDYCVWDLGPFMEQELRRIGPALTREFARAKKRIEKCWRISLSKQDAALQWVDRAKINVENPPRPSEAVVQPNTHRCEKCSTEFECHGSENLPSFHYCCSCPKCLLSVEQKVPKFERFKLMTAEEASAMPTPAAGEWGYIMHGSILLPVLRWSDNEGKPVHVVATPDGLLNFHHDPCVRAKTNWLPEHWEIDVFPAGWTLPNIEAWFRWAINLALNPRNRNRGDVSAYDSRPSYLPTQRMLVRHAYLVAHQLGLTPRVPEPLVPIDLDGSVAALEDLRSFLRNALTPSPLPLPGPPERAETLIDMSSADVQKPLTGAQRDSAFQSLKPAEQKAYLAFVYAESKEGVRLEDAEAHKLLDEQGISSNEGKLGKLIDYELPNFDTWSRQLRTARKALREQKYKRRGPTRTTRSIVHGDQIENRSADE